MPSLRWIAKILARLYNAIGLRVRMEAHGLANEPGSRRAKGNSTMKSIVSAIAASLLTVLAFAPASLAKSGVETMALIAPTAFRPSAQMAPTRETLMMLAQLSVATGETSDDTAVDPSDSGDSAADNSAQSDDTDNGENPDADNADTDPNEQSADQADNADADQNARSADNGDSPNADNSETQTDGVGADQNSER